MATPIKLASGKWRCQYMIDGKRRSVTRDTKKEAGYAALELSLKRKREVANVTVGQAVDDYISMKDGVLSVTTISAYRKMRKANVQELMDMPIKSITPKIVQSAFNNEAKKISKQGKPYSPKTLRNVHGLISSALKIAAPDVRLDTRLPAKQKKIVEMPDAATMIDLLRGTDIELPCLLAMWLSLSKSEVRGIMADAIKDGYVTIRRAVVDVDNLPVEKDSTKAYDRTRVLHIPEYIMQLIEQTDAYKADEGYIVTLAGNQISNRLDALTEKAGLPHVRFHDLRHLNASIMLMLGVPDKYAMERGGWSTPNIMKTVYQHTLSVERQEVDRRIDEYFNKIIAHETAHDNDNS